MKGYSLNKPCILDFYLPWPRNLLKPSPFDLTRNKQARKRSIHGEKYTTYILTTTAELCTSFIFSGEDEACQRLASCAERLQRHSLPHAIWSQNTVPRTGGDLSEDHLHITDVQCSRVAATVPELLHSQHR